MLFKEKDSTEDQIRQLEKIIKLPDISEKTLNAATAELKTLKSGIRGENNSAYFINFHYKQNHNWAVIHDLRFVYQGFVAQIDHLLINRFLEIYVLESKNYVNGIKITDDGEFLVWYNQYKPIESPIEQNHRHVIALERLLRGKNLLPTRLGITLTPSFKPFVLVSPKSKIFRPKPRNFNTDMVIKADVLFRQIEQEFDNIGTIASIGVAAKMVSRETIYDLARRLMSYHQPAFVDYFKKFGIEKPRRQLLKGDLFKKPVVRNGNQTQNVRQQQNTVTNCFNCGKPVSSKVEQYCLDNRAKFDGRIYCYQCQRTIKKTRLKNG